MLDRAGGELRFGNGVTLTDVVIQNDEGIFEAMPDDVRYIRFALNRQDGLPLAETKRASLSLVSTSFNTDFVLGTPGNPTERGTLPVLHARVGGVIRVSALAGMHYTLRDWHVERDAE